MKTLPQLFRLLRTCMTAGSYVQPSPSLSSPGVTPCDRYSPSNHHPMTRQAHPRWKCMETREHQQERQQSDMITGGLLSAGSKLAMSRTRVATPTLTPGDQTRVTPTDNECHHGKRLLWQWHYLFSCTPSLVDKSPTLYSAGRAKQRSKHTFS